MPVEIKWFGHASFRIATGQNENENKNVLYIDPWKLPGALHDADAVFVSHSHHDHCSKEDVQKVSKDDTTVVAPSDTIMKLSAANAVSPGDLVTVKEITIEAVAAYNIGKTFHPRGHNWCGAVFTIAGKRVYYAGDTDLIPEMSDLKDVDAALLPVGGTYTLNAQQAAEACKAIGCKLAVPYHWGDIVGSKKDASEFAKAAPCKVSILLPGEYLTL